MTVRVLVGMLGWLFSLILGSNWVDHQYLVRLAYNDSYHMSLNMVLYMVLCDDYTGCLNIRQDQTSMSLWVSNHGKYDGKIHINCDRLVTNGLLQDCVGLSI